MHLLTIFCLPLTSTFSYYGTIFFAAFKREGRDRRREEWQDSWRIGGGEALLPHHWAVFTWNQSWDFFLHCKADISTLPAKPLKGCSFKALCPGFHRNSSYTSVNTSQSYNCQIAACCKCLGIKLLLFKKSYFRNNCLKSTWSLLAGRPLWHCCPSYRAGTGLFSAAATW